MITYKYVVSDKQGLHATNAMSLSRAASEYESRITLKSQKGTADCKNVLALMSLGAHQGESLELTLLPRILRFQLQDMYICRYESDFCRQRNMRES